MSRMFTHAAFLATLLVSTPVFPSCVDPPATTEEIKTFLADPARILSLGVSSAGLIGTVRKLAGSDVETLSAIFALIPKSNSLQRVALGVGLAQTRIACDKIDPGIAKAIDKLVVTINDSAFIDAYYEAESGLFAGGGYLGSPALGGTPTLFSSSSAFPSSASQTTHTSTAPTTPFQNFSITQTLTSSPSIFRSITSVSPGR